MAVKNQIRAALRGAGLTAVKGLWRRVGPAWLLEQDTPPAERLRMEMVADELAQINSRVLPVEQGLGL